MYLSYIVTCHENNKWNRYKIYIYIIVYTSDRIPIVYIWHIATFIGSKTLNSNAITFWNCQITCMHHCFGNVSQRMSTCYCSEESKAVNLNQSWRHFRLRISQYSTAFRKCTTSSQALVSQSGAITISLHNFVLQYKDSATYNLPL